MNNIMLFSVVISIVLVTISELISTYSRRRKRAAKKEIPPGERVRQSISKLSTASKEIDDIIQDIVQDLKVRQVALEELKARQQCLSQEEGELSKRVEILKDFPVEGAKYFQQINEKILQQMEKKRARRDILMLFLGIIVTTIITILLKAVWMG